MGEHLCVVCLMTVVNSAIDDMIRKCNLMWVCLSHIERPQCSPVTVFDIPVKILISVLVIV